MGYVATAIICVVVMGLVLTFIVVRSGRRRDLRTAQWQRYDLTLPSGDFSVGIMKLTKEGRNLDNVRVGTISDSEPDWLNQLASLRAEADQRVVELNEEWNRNSKTQ